jgi:peroxiredoxin
MDGLGVGSRAPDFNLPATTGSEIRLSDYLGKSAVILFFVREYN